MKNTFKRVLTLVVALAMVVSCFAMLSTISVMAAGETVPVWSNKTELIPADVSTMDSQATLTKDLGGVVPSFVEDDADHGNVLKFGATYAWTSPFWDFTTALNEYMEANPADSYKLTFTVDLKASEALNAHFLCRQSAPATETMVNSVTANVKTSWKTFSASAEITSAKNATGLRFGFDSISPAGSDKVIFIDNLSVTVEKGEGNALALGREFVFTAETADTAPTYPVFRGSAGLTEFKEGTTMFGYTFYNENDFAIKIEMYYQNGWSGFSGAPNSGVQTIPAHSSKFISASYTVADGKIKGTAYNAADMTLRFDVKKSDDSYLCNGAKFAVAYNETDGTDPMKNVNPCAGTVTRTLIAELPVDWTPEAAAVGGTGGYVITNGGIFANVDFAGEITKDLEFAVFFKGAESSAFKEFQVAYQWGSSFYAESVDKDAYEKESYDTAWNKLYPDDQREITPYIATMPKAMTTTKKTLSMANGDLKTFTVTVPREAYVVNFQYWYLVLCEDGSLLTMDTTSAATPVVGALFTNKAGNYNYGESPVAAYAQYAIVTQNDYYSCAQLGIRLNGTFVEGDAMYFTCLNDAAVNKNLASVSAFQGKAATVDSFFDEKEGDAERLIAATNSEFAVLAGLAEAKVLGANVALGDTLTVNYYTNVPGTMTLNNKEIAGVYDDFNKAYKFSYTGINPQCMGDVISGTFTDNNGNTIDVDDYSVKAYCEEKASEPGLSTALKNLLADMLDYGAEAQKYVGYKTDDLVNDVAALEGFQTTYTKPASKKSVLSANTTGMHTAKIKSASIVLNNTVDMVFKFDLTNMFELYTGMDPESTFFATVKINGVIYDDFEISEDFTSARIYGFSAQDFDDEVVFTITDSVLGGCVGSVAYSVNSYIASKEADITVGALAQALARYGASAAALVVG